MGPSLPWLAGVGFPTKRRAYFNSILDSDACRKLFERLIREKQVTISSPLCKNPGRIMISVETILNAVNSLSEKNLQFRRNGFLRCLEDALENRNFLSTKAVIHTLEGRKTIKDCLFFPNILGGGGSSDIIGQECVVHESEADKIIQLLKLKITTEECNGEASVHDDGIRDSISLPAPKSVASIHNNSNNNNNNNNNDNNIDITSKRNSNKEDEGDASITAATQQGFNNPSNPSQATEIISTKLDGVSYDNVSVIAPTIINNNKNNNNRPNSDIQLVGSTIRQGMNKHCSTDMDDVSFSLNESLTDIDGNAMNIIRLANSSSDSDINININIINNFAANIFQVFEAGTDSGDKFDDVAALHHPATIDHDPESWTFSATDNTLVSPIFSLPSDGDGDGDCNSTAKKGGIDTEICDTGDIDDGLDSGGVEYMRDEDEGLTIDRVRRKRTRYK